MAGRQGQQGNSSSPAQDSDFPLLTEEIHIGDRSGGGTSTGAGPGAGAVVERELRAVLGVRPRASDPKGFLAALQQAFTVTEVSGHTEVTWNPRSYAIGIQADLGAVTGAQASLYVRVKGTLDQVLPLLDGLRPLRVDVDPENLTAIQAIIRSRLTELVHELGVEGGPRVRRVDELLDFLLGDEDGNATRDPAKVGGAFKTLRSSLGMEQNRINTIEEEQNYTNFLIVLDHVTGLAESWDAQRLHFVRGDKLEPFLGTQLVLLSRDLEVIAESVHEVEFAMNSVFLGPAERQTLDLRFPTDFNCPPMFVSELLSWVERFAMEEGRQLIDEGGKHGVAAFRDTVQLLTKLVKAMLMKPAQPKGDPGQDPERMPAAYQSRRVQRALAELALHLSSASDRVKGIQAPDENPPPASNRGQDPGPLPASRRSELSGQAIVASGGPRRGGPKAETSQPPSPPPAE